MNQMVIERQRRRPNKMKYLMNAVEANGDDVCAPEGARRARTIARRDASTVESNGHVEGTRFTLGRLLGADHRRTQMESYNPLTSFDN